MKRDSMQLITQHKTTFRPVDIKPWSPVTKQGCNILSSPIIILPLIRSASPTWTGRSVPVTLTIPIAIPCIPPMVPLFSLALSHWIAITRVVSPPTPITIFPAMMRRQVVSTCPTIVSVSTRWRRGPAWRWRTQRWRGRTRLVALAPVPIMLTIPVTTPAIFAVTSPSGVGLLPRSIVAGPFWTAFSSPVSVPVAIVVSLRGRSVSSTASGVDGRLGSIRR